MGPPLCGFLRIDQILCRYGVVGGFLNLCTHLDRTDSPSIDQRDKRVLGYAADLRSILVGHAM